ncbi:pleckstrin homology domain-containing family A member 1 isoform X1 [Lingula anatina]|uniref:Pleckstrin homology domain-containing family A member 1 isoform X1 n=1 Tax=Lingula anatina TaxID=7574 RepID=A0A1S3IMP0_LINAN|nr:pleckstrin homology domain-containing family A member 1 isoform X1 [Lingula anatina]XP_013399467.1 pleckstrin homology domain-containing family A member 1 isoform X1 [Lingula anatina]|eukprot:XP_013399466.1 pleckstrin homology domain-containing family A member 1 isoform X1 [Lingula anatina]
MLSWDGEGRPCGYLEYEEKENSGHFVEIFVRLEKDKKLAYYTEDPKKSHINPLGVIPTQYISQVNDVSKQRPKFPYCFAVTVAGKRHFFKSQSKEEEEEWIKLLTDASKITVPKSATFDEARGRSFSDSQAYKTEIVGGAIQKTVMSEDDLSSTSSDEDDKNFHQKESIHQGYCVKQGGVVKNWKRRFFVLDEDRISYYKNEKWQGKRPIKSIDILNVKEAKQTERYKDRDNLFELVTRNRTFYVQCDTCEDMYSWIAIINKTVSSKHQKKISQFENAQERCSLTESTQSVWL